MEEIDIDEKEIRVEILSHEGVSGVAEYLEWINTAPIKLTHIPTGVTAIGEGQGSQVKNYDRALALLKEILKTEQR